MIGELKYYLIVANKSGVLKTLVYRKQALLLEELEELIHEQQDYTILLHVGVILPGFDKLRSMMQGFEGYILLTASARWTINTDFEIFKYVCGYLLEFREKMPIYVVKKINNKNFSYDHNRNYTSEMGNIGNIDWKNKSFSDGWIQLLNQSNSALFLELFRLNILTDNEYLNKRRTINKHSAYQIEIARYNYLLPSINTDSPFDLVNIVPIQYLETPIKNLNLTVRLNNIFTGNNITILRDLLSINNDIALAWQNFGKKCLTDLYSVLLEFMKKMAPDYSNLNAGAIEQLNSQLDTSSNQNIEDDTNTHLSLLLDEYFRNYGGSERNYRIFRESLGESGTTRTLNEIAQSFGLTRERVRQLKKKLFNKIIYRATWPKLLLSNLDDLLKQRTNPLKLTDLPCESDWFRGFETKEFYLGNIIEAFSNSIFQVIQEEEDFIVTRINQDTWDSIKKDLIKEIKLQVQLQLTEQDIKLIIRSTLSSHKADELTDFLYTLLYKRFNFKNSDKTDEKVLHAVSDNLRSMIKQVIMSSNDPLHYLEVTHQVNLLSGKESSTSSINSRLQNSGFYLFARGTYGTIDHIKLSADEQAELLEILELTILTHPTDKQWTCAELVESVVEFKPDIEDYIDKYIINILLKQSDNCKYLGRMVWARKGAQKQRIDILNAMEAILSQNGEPMSKKEVINRLSQFTELKFQICNLSFV